MKKYLLILGTVLGIAVFLFAFTNNISTKVPAGGGDKVTICHIPPGNPGNAHEITVGASAVAAHLAHGDHLGSCSCETKPPCETPPPCEPVCKPVCQPVWCLPIWCLPPPTCQPRSDCD